MDNYQYNYIVLAIVLWIIGYIHLGKVIRPKWKIPGKFVRYIAVSALLVYWVGHYALIYIIADPLIGLAFHTYVCKKYDINWFTCKPLEKYIQLTEKWSKGKFSSSTDSSDKDD